MICELSQIDFVDLGLKIGAGVGFAVVAFFFVISMLGIEWGSKDGSD